MYPHSFREDFCSVPCCDTLLASRQYNHLRESIHNHKYIVITMLGRREARKIVHGDGLPGLVGSRKRSVHAFLLDGWLGDGISNAGSDIFSNILSVFWLIKRLM